jgi:hypothetical protein
MLSDTRVVVSDFIVKVKSFGRKSVDTTTVFENSFELLAEPVATSSFALRLAAIVVVFLHFCCKRGL